MKEKKINFPDQPSINDQISEHPAIQWVVDHGRDLVLIAAIVTLSLILLFRFTAQSSDAATDDFINADRLMTTLESAPDFSSDAYQQLVVIMNNHPELHQKYDSMLAQVLLLKGEPQKAAEYETKSLHRITDTALPYYSDFAKTSLLISQDQYQEALKEAQSLQDQMKKELPEANRAQKFGEILFSYNLLRIGMLEQQLGLKEESESTWKEWMQLMNETDKTAGVSHASFEKVYHLFQSGNLTLKDYFEFMKK